MLRSLFVTYRSELLPGWLAAFPDAVLVKYETLDQVPQAGIKGQALVWLHLNQSESALDQLRAVSASFPGMPVVVLANVPEEDQALALLGAGAFGYASSLSIPKMLRQVATVVGNGGLWVGPNLIRRFLTAVGTRPGWETSGQVLDSLSRRKREVAEAACSGASNKEIARQLGITERTVKAHISSVLEHFGVRDRLQLSLLVNGARPSRK